MEALLQPLRSLAEYEDIWKYGKDNRGVLSVSGCLESQKVHLMYGFSGLFPCRLILAEDERRAREIFEDYRFYDKNVYFYPAKDLLFFQADIHGNLLIRQRMQVIRALLERGEKEITVVTSIDGCMDFLMPLEQIRERLLHFYDDSTVNLDMLKSALVGLGYERVGQVEMPGQFCIRGGIVDIYPLTEENPWRIELWGDEIDSVRSFDAETQRSLENLKEITIYPAVEKTEEKNPVSFLSYFPTEKTLVFLDEPNRLLERGKAVEEEYLQSRMHREEKGEAVLPRQWMCGCADVVKALNLQNCIGFSTLPPHRADWKITEEYNLTVKSVTSYNGSFELLVKDLALYKRQDYRVTLLSGSRTRAQRLARDLQDNGLNAFYSQDYDRVIAPGEILVLYGHAHRGFEYPLVKFAVITETDIFGQEQTRRKKKKTGKGPRIQDFGELCVGDYVIHEKHGLGIYRGIEKVEVDRVVKDYIKIEYQGGSNLYIPATQLDMLQKYSGSGENGEGKALKLNSLGGQEWNRTKSRVRGAVKDIARELVDLYAARQQKEGFVCGPDTVWQKEFEEMFPYEETEDQIAAIEDTKRDMESSRIMDRLICGDVGYGKTEVALRAAFKAVQESRQVVYLVPTTILAQQHYNTFLQRMKEFPARVDLLCRFRTPAQQKKTIEDLRKGLVDIVIGTHRVLSKDISFKNLGLLIIDEEQRFGVTHKEKIKQLKKDVDVLTMTATPIPRTLHMSLIGIRDMSVLEEPPMDRVPVQTYVMEYDEETVREAISRELRRDGQVYYVYNRVQDIADVASKIAKLVPQARVSFAHGQMSERELEKVMYDFISGEIDVLVSTTIIETGLDIPNVNTMIIHDSDRYGLSQLYQLRGRIGRSNRTAYAFLMYRRDRVLKETAEKRLSAIKEYTDLGSGFKIAMRDLEIRGAGNLLGAQQHGHMNAVGYDLYCKMLSEAVKEAKGIETMEDFETSVDLNLDAFIPDSYIRSEVQKLDIYKRIAGIETQKDYEDMLEELLDRFGEPGTAVLNLLAIARLRAVAHQGYVTEIRQTERGVRFTLYKNARLDPAGIPKLTKKYGNRLQIKNGQEPALLLSPVGNLLTALAGFAGELAALAQNGE
ncbi:MAG: transcription-repair coupling factor [Clostridiales bacterium]|nr:transcription-repair coupling factor [Clostridiales bacterium]